MDYIKLAFDRLPEVLFSHKHETLAYDYYFGDKKPFLEITYFDKGDVFSQLPNGEIYQTREKTLFTCWKKPRHISSHGMFHRHFTIAVGGQCDTQILSHTEAVAFLETANSSEDIFTVLLPQEITDPKVANQGYSMIESIIFERNLPTINQLNVHTLLFTLLNTMTTYSYDTLISEQHKRFSDEYYCRKAVEYINTNRSKKITIFEIASELELSCGYLCRIFKANTGYTLVEYINTIKINTIKEILSNRSASLSELCDIVGITDSKYLCRLFKKYTSMTISDFRHLQQQSRSEKST